MLSEQSDSNKRIVGVTIFALIVFVLVFYAFNYFTYREKQGNRNNYEPYRGILEGEYVCLPLSVAEGPQTVLCEVGLKTATRDYYVVDFNLMSQEKQTLEIGDHIQASGIITPIERISNDYWRQYDVKGIFSVTDSLQIVK